MARRISRPRASGTAGDASTCKFLREAFGQVPGLVAGSQRVEFSRAYMNVVLNVVHPAVASLVALTLGLVSAGRPAAVLATSCVGWALALFSRRLVAALQFSSQRWGRRWLTTNLWFRLGPFQEGARSLVFVAHRDSISHRLSPVLEGLGYFAGFVGGTAYFTHAAVFSAGWLLAGAPPGSPLQLAWGLPFAGLAALELVNLKGNASPGGLDNASGVAACYHLACRFAEHPLRRVNVAFLLTGAEEWGDVGANAFVEENPLRLSPRNAFFVVVDSVGVPGKDKAIWAAGWPRRPWCPSMLVPVREIVEETDSPVRPFAIPPLLQVSSDHVPIIKAGYEVLLVASTSLRFHSPRDVPELVDQVAFEATCEFLEALARRLDDALEHHGRTGQPFREDS